MCLWADLSRKCERGAFLCRLNWSGSPTATSDLWARSVKAAGGLERLFISSREAHNTLFTFSFSRRIIEARNKTTQSNKQLSQTSEDWWSFSRMLITLTKQFTWKTSFSADLRTRGCRAFHPRRLSRFETWLCYLCLVFCETDVDAQTSRTISQTTQRHSDGWRESHGESEPLETNWRESRNRTSRSEGVTSTASVTIVIIQPVKVLHSHVIKLFNRFMTAATMFRRGLENCIFVFFLSRCGFFLLNATELSDCCYRLAALTDVWEEFRLKDMSRNRCVIILR